MTIYHDGFSSWADVRREFTSSSARYDNKLKDSPVPNKVERVLFAAYTSEGYDGSALVLFQNDGKFFHQSGGHCSCYGLEGQWDPTEYPDAATFRACVERELGNGYGITARFEAQLRRVLAKL